MRIARNKRGGYFTGGHEQLAPLPEVQLNEAKNNGKDGAGAQFFN